MAPFQFGQEDWSLLLGSCLPHDLAAVQRLTLARRFSGRAIRQQILHSEPSRVRDVCVQRMHHRRPFLNDPNPRMAVTVESPLVALGQAEPPLQIEIVADLLERGLADKKTRDETDHDPGHLVVNRITGAAGSARSTPRTSPCAAHHPPVRDRGSRRLLRPPRHTLGASFARPRHRSSRGRCSRLIDRVALCEAPFSRMANLTEVAFVEGR